jgi:hypothetical protein
LSSPHHYNGIQRKVSLEAPMAARFRRNPLCCFALAKFFELAPRHNRQLSAQKAQSCAAARSHSAGPFSDLTITVMAVGSVIVAVFVFFFSFRTYADLDKTRLKQWQKPRAATIAETKRPKSVKQRRLSSTAPACHVPCDSLFACICPRGLTW